MLTTNLVVRTVRKAGLDLVLKKNASTWFVWTFTENGEVGANVEGECDRVKSG